MIIILLLINFLSCKICFCMEDQYPSLTDDFSLALAGVAMGHESLLFDNLDLALAGVAMGHESLTDDFSLALAGLEPAEAISAEAQPIPKEPIPKEHGVLPHKPSKKNILSAEDRAKIVSIEATLKNLKENKTEYHCSYCNASFIITEPNGCAYKLYTVKKQYKLHLETHIRYCKRCQEYKLRDNLCEACNKNFSNKTILSFHRKTCSKLKQK